MSYARAAYVTDWYELIQVQRWVSLSVILDAHVPHDRCRAPWYILSSAGGGGRSRFREENTPTRDIPPRARDGCAWWRGSALLIGGWIHPFERRGGAGGDAGCNGLRERVGGTGMDDIERWES